MRDKQLEALGRAKVAYLALSGVRNLLRGQGDKLEEAARKACAHASGLECALLIALSPKREP